MSELLIGFSILGTLGWCLSLLEAIVALGVVIFVHELGHFMVAKLCGVKCEKFYLGFDVNGLKLWHRQWGETEYGIGIVPLGGYVKMLGQDDNPSRAAEERERSKVHSKLTEHGGDLPPEPHEGETEQLDPRSYMAKSVPQRMAIISAGVIMNLIFAVIFATIAYRMGISYTPCIIGTPSPGDPAWTAGIRPGDKIIQFDDQRQDEHLRYEDDLMQTVLLTGNGNELPLLVQLPGSDKTERIVVQPTDKHKDSGRAIIGVTPMMSNKLPDFEPLTVPGSPAAHATPALEAGDRLIAATVAGKKTDLANGNDIQATLAQHPDEPITFTVERHDPKAPEAKPTPIDAVIEPNPTRYLGLVPVMGPIAAVQAGSPAEKAGFKAGDLIVAVNGQKPGDPLRLPDQMRKLAGSDVVITVHRGSGSTGSDVMLHVEPRQPTTVVELIVPDTLCSSDELGIAYEVPAKVQSIDPHAPAEAKAIAPGDEIAAIEFVPANEKQTKERNELKLPNERVEFGPDHGQWPFLQSLIQWCPADLPIKVTYRHDGKEQSATLHSIVAADWFCPQRGLLLMPYTKIRRADSWGEALSLGFRETKESVSRTALIVRKLVNGSVSATNLGGPLTIAAVATSSASEGIPKLLIFLTLLSANLAVLNFLPIPILDGGHMMFLLYEGIRGKPASERAMTALTYLGLAFILTLMLFVLGLDFMRFGKWFIHLFS